MTEAYYAVMKVFALSNFTAGGFPLRWEDDGLVGLIPIFKDRQTAIAFDGSNQHVQRIVAEKPAPPREGGE